MPLDATSSTSLFWPRIISNNAQPPQQSSAYLTPTEVHLRRSTSPPQQPCFKFAITLPAQRWLHLDCSTTMRIMCHSQRLHAQALTMRYSPIEPCLGMAEKHCPLWWWGCSPWPRIPLCRGSRVPTSMGRDRKLSAGFLGGTPKKYGSKKLSKTHAATKSAVNSNNGWRMQNKQQCLTRFPNNYT